MPRGRPKKIETSEMEKQLAVEVKDEVIKEVLKPNIPQTFEELQFADAVEKALPLLEQMKDLLANGRLSLKSQKYRIDNNDQIIRSQEKTISDNNKLIEASRMDGERIVKEAQNRADEVNKTIQMKMAQANHMEREAQVKYEQADKALWKSNNG